MVAQHWPEASRPVAWRDVTAAIGPLRFERPEGHVFRAERYLAPFLRERGGRVPAVDFGRSEVVIVAAGPRSTTADRVEVVSVRARGGRVVVTVRERTPLGPERVAPRLTFPYRAIEIARSGRHVTSDWEGRE